MLAAAVCAAVLFKYLQYNLNKPYAKDWAMLFYRSVSLLFDALKGKHNFNKWRGLIVTMLRNKIFDSRGNTALVKKVPR